ncbi:hypothetical protein [Amycolatopsis marina]|uniref:hypothetical protein n=1 Tax=Amycolatopsis marina TaxID=490629 RepID=UPI001FE3C5B1|nr:hypothetical protein [Amycolatopsis marina]
MNRITSWVVAAAVIGLIGFFAAMQPWRSTSDLARSIAGSLRESSVHVAEDAPGLVNPDRARTVIGDRAIVAAILGTAPLQEYADSDQPNRDLCKDIAELAPTNLVIVFAADKDGEYDSAYCNGPDFPDPTQTDEDADRFALGVIIAAETAWSYRTTETDRTPEIEEYVLAFDAEAGEQYGKLPRRGTVPDLPTFGRLALTAAAMVACTVVLFLILRSAALAARRKARTERARSRLRSALDARLNRLADIVLHEPGAANAEAAQRYVETLHRFREADERGQLDEVRAEVDELEKELRR